MKIFYALRSIVTAFFILIYTVLPCFSQNDDDLENQNIEFDFSNNSFNKVFPFDSPFDINLKNIPSGVNFIEIRINEGDLGHIDDPKPRSFTSPVLIWHKPNGATTNGKIVIPYRLRPNHNYEIVVLSGQETSLTASEKNNLSSTLQQDNEIRNIINDAAQEFIRNPTRPPDYSSLNITQARFNEIANRSVQKENRDFRVNQIDPIAQLSELTLFINSLDNINDALNNLKTSNIVNENPNKQQILKAISDFQRTLKVIQWGSINTGDNGFTNLTSLKDNIFSTLDDSIPSIASVKAEFDDFLSQILTQRDNWIKIIIDNTIVAHTFKLTTSNATFRADFVKNAKLYISMDVGVAYVGQIDRILAYSGTNIYFRPISKSIPLKKYNEDKFLNWLGVRTSLLIGISLTSFEKANIRKGILGNSALVLGAGIRPTSFMKINAGGFVYYKYSRNPLRSQESFQTSISPFISVSIDLDAKSLFGGVGEAIFK